MSGGEIRVLRQEAGQESPRMPAWKREILERRKAKGGGAGAGAAEPCPSASSSRVNGEVTGNGSGSKKDNASCAATGRNYTVASASQHLTGKRGSSTVTSPELSPVKTNKDPWTDTDGNDSAERTAREDGGHESLVLQDSLGPLQENPFIKLEKERKKRQDRENASRPVQHILELYGSVPGIRTIRAENIIIIESDPDYFLDTSGAKSSSTLQQNGVGNYSSLNDLMDRRGSAVTEIRAKEVVIYDTALSRSEENLSTLGRPGYEGSLEPGDAQGMVSRMLQKFDSNYAKLQPKCRSTENLLDLETSVNRTRSRPILPDLVPKHSSSLPQPGSPVRSLVRPGWSSPVLQGPLAPRPQNSAGAPQPLSPSSSKPVSGGGCESPESISKPKVPCSPETLCPRAVPPSLASSTSPPSPTFEIRPAARPDLSQLPAGDIQARALANLRLQSRNSFTVIPKRHASSSSVAPGNTAPPIPASSLPFAGVPTPLSPTPTLELSSREEETIPVSPSPDLPPPASPTSPPPSSPPPEVFSTEHLPITNIDDIDVEPGPPVGPPGPPYPSPVVQKRKGNTFTVVPKRKPQPPQPPQPQVDPQPQLASPQPQTDSQPQEDHSGGASPASTPPPAPYAHLGSLLKKRYPAVEEIEVIGGYLSLGRSCLSKTSSMGKKLKISFNESSLQNTYEYPSESSVWDSGEEEEEEGGEKGGGGEEEEPRSIVGRIHIPRPGFSSSPSHTPNSSDLSSYTPKHTVDFNTWQEHKLDDLAYQGDANSQRAQISEDVMLTPADCSSLSDFSSEPALYF